MAPVLAYWNIRGLAQPIRNLLHYKGVEFEDKMYILGPPPNYKSQEWLDAKPTLGLDWPNLPYYIDGDVKLTQSLAILRHLARKHGLVGDNEADTMKIELAEQQAVDIRTAFGKLFFQSSDFEKDKAEYLNELPAKLEKLSKFLDDNKWVAGDKMTYVDFIVYEQLDLHRLMDEKSVAAFPNLTAYLARFEEIPQIKAYFAGGNYKRIPFFLQKK